MDSENRNQLIKHTNRLLEMNQYAEDIYLNHTRTEGYEVDFFGLVKPFAEEAKVVSEEWLPLAEELVKEHNPKDLHANQLVQTVDNFEVVAIKSFYPKTSRKTQIETFKAVDYVLRQVEDLLKTE
ncbi:YppE family protein [Alkalicoccobacillus plakortidis]|uniref:YppE family protein n=1 Tax=Alkalicoccobacillus plakortidis TaxID=444060 RepID=A0ABT0XGQ4_9BACI|nr:YppE family protein [Alkalicoccobacillus plakortidis]MCM2674382.1 YppE family protein [Alkalicoccobacillus plakortidis]